MIGRSIGGALFHSFKLSPIRPAAHFDGTSSISTRSQKLFWPAEFISGSHIEAAKKLGITGDIRQRIPLHIIYEEEKRRAPEPEQPRVWIDDPSYHPPTIVDEEDIGDEDRNYDNEDRGVVIIDIL